MISFNEKLSACIKRNGSHLCVGLDPDPAKMPKRFDARPRDLFEFNRAIIEVTSDLVCAYKPNLAFYEVFGQKGIKALVRTLKEIPEHIPVILDAKRGDIGNTGAMYAKAMFEELGGDAVTVNPLMGKDSVEPFLRHEDKGTFVLTLTSNPGASDFELPNNLHHQIAHRCQQWSSINPNIGLVVGATRPEQLREIREICPDLWFLVPGIGAQGGDLPGTINAGGDKLIINSSRGVIHASHQSDFAKVARRAASELREEIELCLAQRNS